MTLYRLFRATPLFIVLLFAACTEREAAIPDKPRASAAQAATKPATNPATKPTTLPVVRAWHPRPFPPDQVNLLAMGDWGAGAQDKGQKAVAETLARYADRVGTQFNGLLSPGDNLYVKLSGTKDYQWQTVFEDMYDPKRVNFPFFCVLGNHDYENDKPRIEQQYTFENPTSRFKMPARWYRVDFPEGSAKPLVSVLALESNKPKMSPEDWQAQLRWMEEQLADRNGAKWMICFAHHPLLSNGSHGDNGVLLTDWGPLLRKYAVDFYICGHDHDLQHLETPGWHTTFIIAGGGGREATSMRRDTRGPFSRKLNGFAHLQFFDDHVQVKLIDAGDGRIAHEFRKDDSGRIGVVWTTGRDKPTTRPLRSIQGLENRTPPATAPAGK
jgi:hypothetical protein